MAARNEEQGWKILSMFFAIMFAGIFFLIILVIKVFIFIFKLVYELFKNIIIEIKNQKAKNIDEELEKEMDYYYLDDYEKELVRKGLYDPWDFDEEDAQLLEEDDYNDENEN